MKSIKALAAISAVALGLLLVPSATVSAATARPNAAKQPEPVLCLDGSDGNVKTFPYVMHLDSSDTYPEGARSCSYYGKRRIAYSCKAQNTDNKTFIHVIANVGRERNVIPVVCDGVTHTGTVQQMYGNLNSPNYHVHWHYDTGYWDSAYLAIL